MNDAIEPVGELTEGESNVWDEGFVGEGGPAPLSVEEAEEIANEAIEHSMESDPDFSTDGDTEDDSEDIK